MLRKFTILILLLYPVLLFSQVKPPEPEERLVRLIDAKSAKIEQMNGLNYRKVIGPAQFLHNNALILCDSAIWDVQGNIIDAIGNVKIIQNGTTLSSDNIKYIADRSVAEVRGQLVEMVDKEKNKLRTHFLDYFTKDSMAMFYNGGCMMDKDGNTIESLNGFYYGKLGKFVFQTKVEMNSDSVQLVADSLAYFAKESKAKFLSKTYAWQKGGFLFAKGGWYDRKAELFHFTNDAYIKNQDNEIWADTINYNKIKAEAELFNNVQILDTAHSSLIFSDYASFKQKPFKIILTNKPSVASYSVKDGIADTLFFAADTIVYHTLAKNLVDSATIAQSIERRESSNKDAIADMYKSKTELAKKPKLTGKPGELTPQGKIQEAPQTSNKDNKTVKQPVSPPEAKPKRGAKGKKDKAELLKKENPAATPIKDTVPDLKTVLPKDTIIKQEKTVLLATAKDTVKSKADTTGSKPVIDTTQIKFIYAHKNIKLFKSDMQCICDSLRFNSLDSLIRLFKDPVVWSESKQITSDSVQIAIVKGQLNRADFNSSAFVIMQEDSVHFNQIKGADIVAYFKNQKLSRFDAYGGVSALYFFQEDSVVTTMNEKECKTLSATFSKEQEIERIRYFESIKSNAYPLFKLEKEKQRLKGFQWRETERPERKKVCDRIIKPSQATLPDSVERPTFMQAGIYFNKKGR